MHFLSVNASIEISKSFLLKFSKKLIAIVKNICLPILNISLKFLTNHLFSFEKFLVILNKLSKFSIKPLFGIKFEKISYYYLTSDIFFAFCIIFQVIEDKKDPRYI